MIKKRSICLGAIIALLFYGIMIIEILISTILFNHADTAIVVQISLCIILVLSYNLIEKNTRRIYNSNKLVYDISFYGTVIILIILYWYLVNSSLTEAYLLSSKILSGIEYLLMLAIFLITTIILVIIRSIQFLVILLKRKNKIGEK